MARKGTKNESINNKYLCLWFVALAVALALTAAPAIAADKPNILFIMGDDIGIMQPGIYHRGWMVGETPNIDRIGLEDHLSRKVRDLRLGMFQAG